ncbi:gastrula zinc finger protein xFG20-1-like [Gouania willdenowi]|uniref:gastrula zinc finger protein xFG20-1-like n=1 Tax=Gouania willdenowi TaxID=441366 RepID=UPI001055CE38|nr:gastrula zinc finger protein xFG20-1-like [Gouania willdenowi]
MLCSDHFTEDCFQAVPGFKQSFSTDTHQSRRVMKAHAIPTVFIHHDTADMRQSAAVSELQHNTMIQEIMTEEAEQTEEKQEIKALFQTRMIPANTLCGESAHGKQLPGHLHIKKEEEELLENWEQMQEMDIIAVTVGSEDEEEAQCSLLNWGKTEENIKPTEHATYSSAKVTNVEQNGDISEGPEAANTSTQQDTDGEETDCSDTDDSEDWREPLSQSEAQSEDLAMSCEKFQTSEVKKKNNTKLKAQKSEKNNACDVCGKRFRYKGYLKVHATTHTGEKPFGCDVCGKYYTQKSSLNLHMRKHRGDEPFGCSVCSQTFTQKSSLSRHMMIHKGGKPFSCDVCGKRFTLKSYMNKHMQIHTREKPLHGDDCSKTFSPKTLPMTKKQNRPRKKLYECEVCGQSFAKSLNLKKHLNIHALV